MSKNKLVTLVLSVVIIIACIYLSVFKIPSQINTYKNNKNELYRSDITRECKSLDQKFLTNSMDILLEINKFILINNIELTDDKLEYTKREKDWLVISQYYDEYFVDTDTWGDYRLNFEVTAMISLFRAEFMGEPPLADLIYKREEIYVTREELAKILEENEEGKEDDY